MKRAGPGLLLAVLLTGTGFQEGASDVEARARALVIPIEAKEADRTLLSAGVLIHAGEGSGLVAVPIRRFKYERLNLEKAAISCIISGKPVTASIVAWMEEWGVALVSIKADTLPKPPAFMPEPPPNAPPPMNKLIVGGLAKADMKSRAEVGPPLEASSRALGVNGMSESPAWVMQLTFGSDALDPVGGPVLDPEGRLAAVIVEGTGRQGRSASYSSVCAWSLQSLLTGLLATWSAEVSERGPDQCRIKIEGIVCNPLGRIREVRAAHDFDKIRDAVNQAQPVFLDAGVIGPSGPLMTESRLKLEGGRLSGDVVVSKEAAAGKDCVLQLRLLIDGMHSRYSRPRAVQLSFPEGAKPGPSKDDWMEAGGAKPEGLAVRTVVNVDASFTQLALPGQDFVPDLHWGDGGKALLVLEKNGTLRRISIPGFKEELRLDIGYECRALQMSREGLLVLGKDRPELALVDLQTLKIKTRIVIDPAVSLTSSPKSTWALAGAARQGLTSTEIQVVDLLEGKKIASQNYQRKTSDGPRPMSWNRIALSPDGRFLATWDANGVHRFRFSRDRLVHEETAPVNSASSDDDHICWSPDSLYFATTGKSGDRREFLVFKSASLKEPLLRIKATGWGTGFGFDPGAGLVYGAGHSKALAIYDAQGNVRKEYPLWPDTLEFVRKMFVHPDGRRGIAIGKGIVAWFEWPR